MNMKPCPEFLDAQSPEGLEVFQLTPEEATSAPIYPDWPGFLEDGRALLLHTSSGPRICRPDEGGSLQPLRDWVPDIGWFQLAPDGRHVVCRRGENRPGVLDLHRLDLRTGRVEPLFRAEGLLKGTRLPVDRMHLEAISWDGARLGALAYLDYDRKADGDTGIVVMDTAAQSMDIVFSQPYSHSHLRYFPSSESPATRTLMVQHQHDRHLDEQGKQVPETWRAGHHGVDLHLLRDDGTGWHDLPFGRDGVESCIGHQVWRGDAGEVASVMLQSTDNSYGWADGTRQHVVSGFPVPADPLGPHCGRCGRDAWRRDLSRPETSPRLCHLAVDRSGLRFVFDTFAVWSGNRSGMALYLGEGADDDSPLTFRYLLNSGVLVQGGNHAHPIINPAGDAVFFASNFFGRQQAYMMTGLPWTGGGTRGAVPAGPTTVPSVPETVPRRDFG